MEKFDRPPRLPKFGERNQSHQVEILIHPDEAERQSPLGHEAGETTEARLRVLIEQAQPERMPGQQQQGGEAPRDPVAISNHLAWEPAKHLGEETSI